MKAAFGRTWPKWGVTFKFPWDEKSPRAFDVSRLLFFFPVWFYIWVFWFPLFLLEKLSCSQTGLITGLRKMGIQQLIVQVLDVLLHLYVTFAGLRTDCAGMLQVQERFCPLYLLFRETSEERRYKSVWDGRRCRKKTWANTGFQRWRRLLVGSSFWRRKKQKEKVKQVLQQTFIFKAIWKWVDICSWQRDCWGCSGESRAEHGVWLGLCQP